MPEQNDSARGTGGAPPIPTARTASDRPSGAATSAAAGTAPRRRGWRERGWDIPWLGGRSSAPWVVLATVLVLAIATIGELYALHRSDRLGFDTKTITATSDTAVTFTFEVRKAPRAVAACSIVAADQQGGVGALRDVIVPARSDGEDVTDMTVVVPTTRRAETAVLEGCRLLSTG